MPRQRSRLREQQDRIAGRQRVLTDPTWGRMAAKAKELQRRKRGEQKNYIVIYDYAGADLMVLQRGPFLKHFPIYLLFCLLIFAPLGIPLFIFVAPLASLVAPVPAIGVAWFLAWRRIRPVQLLAMRKYKSYVLYARDPNNPIGDGMLKDLSISVNAGAVFEDALVFSSPDFRCEKFRVSPEDEEKIQTYKRRVGIRD